MKLHDVIKQLAEDGWCEARRAGSLSQFRHPKRLGVVTVAGRPDLEVFRESGEASLPSSPREERQRDSYAVLIEQGPTSYGASVPDLPGCVAVGRTRGEVERLIQEAMAAHIAGLRHDNLPVPEARTQVTTIDVGK